MEVNKEKNYRKLRRMINKAKKEYTHNIYADNDDTISTMCNLQGYCEAYLDLKLITKKQFYKLDELNE